MPRKVRFGEKRKAPGRAAERKVTVYADSLDERALVSLSERLRDARGNNAPISSLYARALRRWIEVDHPDVWERLYRRADPMSAAR